MAAPRTYTRGFSFAGFQSVNPNRPLPGTSLDGELSNIETSITETIAGLGDIRRADGKLKNGIVDLDAIAFEVTTGLRPATLWQSGATYQAQDAVSFGAQFYRCLVAHTAGSVFATDLAASRWVLYADIGGLATDAQNARNEAVAARNEAVPAATTATAAATEVVTLYDLFDDRYLGQKGSLPSVDNDGGALLDGALVSLTGQTPASLDGMYVRRNGAWQSVLSPFLGSYSVYRYVATAGQTTFTGLDAVGATLAYAPSAVLVTQNGAALAPNAFTATSGNTIVLATPATVGDTLVIHSFGTFSVPGAPIVPFQGTWNAATNTPTITSGAGTVGTFYKVTVAGSTNVNGTTTWNVGDEIWFNGTIWQRIPNPAAALAVTSVAGKIGAVTLNVSDVVGLVNALTAAATPSPHIVQAAQSASFNTAI